MVADTVLIKQQGANEVLTAQASKQWSDVAYNLNASEDEIDEEEELKIEAQDLLDEQLENGNLRRNARKRTEEMASKT